MGKDAVELQEKNNKLKADIKILEERISSLCSLEQQYAAAIRQLTSNLQKDVNEITDKHPDTRPRI